MSMSRAQLAAALWGTLQRQFTEVGIENSDDAGNLKEPLDSTLLALGTAYADLSDGEVDTGDEAAALAIVEYQGLRAALRAYNKVDTTIDAPTVTVRWSQLGDKLRKDVADAAVIVSAALSERNGGSWGVGSLSLGFIEPTTTEYST